MKKPRGPAKDKPTVFSIKHHRESPSKRGRKNEVMIESQDEILSPNEKSNPQGGGNKKSLVGDPFH